MRQAFSTRRKQRNLPALALAAILATASFAAAGPMIPTPYFGSYTAAVDGATVVSGAIGVTATGELYFSGPFSTVTPDRLATLTFNEISGQADPSIAFSVGAQNLSDLSKSFEFTFVIPIALDGTVGAYSWLHYFVYAYTAAGAEIAPTSSAILTAVDSDTAPGGIGDLNKGVNLGSSLAFAGGPGYADSGLLAASNLLAGNLAYDRMVANLGFTLTPHSGASLGGSVEQRTFPDPVPEPATLLLFGSGLLGIAARKRKPRG